MTPGDVRRFSLSVVATLAITSAALAQTPGDVGRVEADIAAAGGRVLYDDTAGDRPIVEVVVLNNELTPADLPSLVTSLASLPHLRKLTLMSGRIRDDDLQHLAPLRQLQDLKLNCHLTGSGVAHLAPLPDLTSLSFVCSGELTDTALIPLRSFPKLKRLSLVATPHVTDTGLKLLRHLPALEELTLKYTGVTSEGLDLLKELPALKRVSLVGSSAAPLSRERIAQLAAELPSCEVTNR